MPEQRANVVMMPAIYYSVACSMEYMTRMEKSEDLRLILSTINSAG